MGDNTIIGVESTKFIKISYILILISSGFGVLANIMALIGVALFGSFITGLLGLVGLLMVVTGWVGFKDKFTEVDISHFKFLVILFLAFFALGIVFGALLVNMGPVGNIILALLSIFQFALLWTGFSLWRSAQAATKDSLINGMKNIGSTFKK